MSLCILRVACCVLLEAMNGIRATEYVLHSQPMQFVLANRIGPVVTLRPDVSVTGLHGAVAESYNVSSPFELQLFGETIVSSRSLTDQPLEEIPRIVSIAQDLNEVYGPRFRVPLRMHRLLASDSDIATYASLARMFGGPDSNIHEFEWYRFILNCVESRSCSIQELPKRFRHQFN